MRTGTGTRGLRIRLKYQKYYIMLFTIILVGVITTGLFQFWPHSLDSDNTHHNYVIRDLSSLPETKIPASTVVPEKGDITCRHHNCLNVYKCGEVNKITIYIYPLRKYIDDNGVPITGQISREFHEVLSTISDSQYYVSDPEKACLFVPAIDMLNQNTIRSHEIGQVLGQLPRWAIESACNLYSRLDGLGGG